MNVSSFESACDALGAAIPVVAMMHAATEQTMARLFIAPPFNERDRAAARHATLIPFRAECIGASCRDEAGTYHRGQPAVWDVRGLIVDRLS